MDFEHFSMIDRVASIDLDRKWIRCLAETPTESGVYRGHFPGYPVVPGVLLTEAMAQSAGHLAVLSLGVRSMVFLTVVRNAKFRRFVSPGDRLEIIAAITHQSARYLVCTASVRREPQEVATAELRFSIAPFPNEEMRSAFLRNVRRIDPFYHEAITPCVSTTSVSPATRS